MPPISEPDSADEYKFSGWLSFYPFKTDVKGELAKETVQKSLYQKLPEYKQGKPTNPGDGFNIANTPELLKNTNLINKYPFLNKLTHIKYIKEEYKNRLAYDEQTDDFVETSTVEISTSDIFWVFPQYLFTRTSKQESEDIRLRMRSILVNSLRTEKIEFDPEFLIWLIYKDYMNERVDNEINLRQLQSIKLVGEDDRFGSQTRISDFQPSASVALLPLLEGKTPESIEAMFRYCDHNIVANIGRDRIRILSSKESPNELSDLEQMALSLSFVSKLTSLYDQWTSLSNDERYPPVSFFKEFYKRAVEEGHEAEGISQELLEKYRKFRGSR